MSCKCANFDSDEGWKCSVSGDRCVFMIPNSKACAETYGEGPDVDQDRCEDCEKFYLEDGKRCCEGEPLAFDGEDIVRSKYIEKDVVCCGGFHEKEAEQ